MSQQPESPWPPVGWPADSPQDPGGGYGASLSDRIVGGGRRMGRASGSGPSGGRSPQSNLRIALAAALAGLLLIAWWVAGSKPSKSVSSATATLAAGGTAAGSATTTARPGATTNKSGKSVRTAAKTPPGAPPTSSPHPSGTTAVPGALTGSVTRSSAGAGCGLSLTGHPSGVSAVVTAATPVGQCTVLEIGDSLGNDIGWGMQRHLAPTSGLLMVQKDKSSSGLSNTDFYNWPVVLESYLRTYHPELVVVCLGGNDEQGFKVNGSTLYFPSAAWQAAYADRVRQLTSEATQAGAYLMWVGMPIMQQPNYSRGIATLDAMYQQGVTSVPNATFVPTWSLFANPQGAFQNNAIVNGAPSTLREPDGIHYSFSGEDVVATYVLREMARVYHVDLAPTNPAVITGW